jgi:hypothetical protein
MIYNSGIYCGTTEVTKINENYTNNGILTLEFNENQLRMWIDGKQLLHQIVNIPTPVYFAVFFFFFKFFLNFFFEKITDQSNIIAEVLSFKRLVAPTSDTTLNYTSHQWR